MTVAIDVFIRTEEGLSLPFLPSLYSIPTPFRYSTQTLPTTYTLPFPPNFHQTTFIKQLTMPAVLFPLTQPPAIASPPAPTPSRGKKPQWGYNSAGTGPPPNTVAQVAKKEEPKPSGRPPVFFMKAPNPNAPPAPPPAPPAPVVAASQNIFFVKAAAPPAPPVRKMLPFHVPPPPPGTGALDGAGWVAFQSPNGVVSYRRPRKRKTKSSGCECGCVVC